ncbi:MAG: ATP-binding protein [Clostridiales bacterium]|nr:ATP-binding protein [Clostridiales bacterium]
MNAYQRAVKEITDTRRDDKESGMQAWRDALSSDERLRAANAYYQEQAVKKAQKLPNDLDKAREQLQANAKRLGLTKDIIEPPVRCKECGDTGYANGRYCKCVIKRVIESDAENLVLPQVNFASAKKTAPKAISKLYAKAEAYINEFPKNEKPFFIILGSAGTGKTMLAAAIATEMLSRGAASVTVSAFDMVKRAKDYHTQFAIDDYRDLFTPMLECDLLVIDDLGTETVLKNITREYFYTIVNERWLRRRNTVITSNLSPNDLLDRYGEAVFSRLCDKSRANLFTVSAPNARM